MTFLILSIFVPISLSMMDNMDENMNTSVAKDEADRIADHSKKAYYSGIGSYSTVDVAFTSGMGVIIGGEGSDAYSIRITHDDRIVDTLYLQRPSVKFLGEPLHLTGTRTISLECASIDGEYGVVVSTID